MASAGPSEASEGNTVGPIETADLVTALNTVEDLIYRLDSLNDPDCFEGITLRLDVLKRYFVNVGIDDRTFELVDTAYRVLHQCEQRFNASRDSTGPRKIYTGRRGKPSFDINEEQVNFLLEQGFNVNEMSNMLGVGKRTLERRMQSFGLSVTGKLCIFYGYKPFPQNIVYSSSSVD